MKFPFFASFIVFCVWLGYELHKHRNIEKKSTDAFWEKERMANSTRRKSLDGLCYITIPPDILSMRFQTDDTVIEECIDTLNELSKEPIVNLTGISNTDLKLQYGAPNISLLTAYDQRYTILARTLQNLGKALYADNYREEAKTVLEFAISTRTDISSTYKLLTTIYKEQKTPEKIASLIPVAESLNSSLKNSIIRMLEESVTCP